MVDPHTSTEQMVVHLVSQKSEGRGLQQVKTKLKMERRVATAGNHGALLRWNSSLSTHTLHSADSGWNTTGARGLSVVLAQRCGPVPSLPGTV